MSHAPPLKHGKLECSASGFTFSSHGRETPSRIAIELGLQPRLTPSGRISKRKQIADQPKSWWEAQIRLYGLECSNWTVNGMKQILADALLKGLQVPDNLNILEQNLIRLYCAIDAEFQAALAEAEERKWNALPSDVHRANRDPERFLRQVLSDNSVKVLRGLDHRALFHQTAERLGLFSHSTDGVRGGYNDRILVVGRDRNQVWQEINRIAADVQAQVRVTQVARRRQVGGMHRVVTQGGDADVGGTWQLEMPELTSVYQDGDIIWTITSPTTESPYVWASFDLLILEGVVRIDWYGQAEWIGHEKKFKWKGTETGEGVIQYDGRNEGTVTFTSANTCRGVWRSDYGTFPFIGHKVSREIDVSVRKLENEFDGYNEAAYEYARVARWRGR